MTEPVLLEDLRAATQFMGAVDKRYAPPLGPEAQRCRYASEPGADHYCAWA
jgi:hypothetical protein